jgi:conjugative relaxase-like TrwC/TraI family protein
MAWGVVVLTVAKIPSGVAAGYADYLQGKTQAVELGDYYLKDGERVEAPGRWIGAAGAVGADPAAPVAGEQLRALMDVRRPDTGAALRPAGGNRTVVAAIDATFSAPKSVSTVWAVGDGELRAAVERAHELAVDRAIRYAVEQVAMIRERVDAGTVIHARAVDVVATGWRHTTARAVADQVPDPQLHSHVLLHAAVRKDGRTVAIDSRSWFVHRRELGAAYRTELARELVQLGFSIQRGTGRGGRYFEIDGIPAALLDRWSSRHHQVQEAIRARLADKRAQLRTLAQRGGAAADTARVRLAQLDRRDRLPAAEDRKAAWSTRAAKALTTTRDLDRHWTRTATDTRFDRGQLQHLRNTPPILPPAPAEPGLLLARLTEFDATFEPREARAVALEASAGVPISEALSALKQLNETGDLVGLADGRATTRLHRAHEQATVQVAARIAAAPVLPLRPTLIERETAALDAELGRRGGQLSDEQRHAIELAGADRRLMVIVGQAGSGKSTTLTGIARAHHADGRRIVVTSTAALAAQRLASDLHDAGVPARSYSTVALHAAISIRRLELGPNVTVIHDEAALASTREQHRLLAAIETSGARLITVGDPRQSHPVGAGGLWPYLEHTAHDHRAHIRLTHNVRARDPADRRDQALFRAGHHHQALQGYATRGRVLLSTDQRRAEDAALEATHADRHAGKQPLVIAQTTNEHLDELNARAQAIRHQAGELGHHSLPLTGRPYHLHPGDHIQIRRTIPHPHHGQLRNGTRATIHHIHPANQTATLQFADGQTATLDRDQLDRAQIRLAYVQHPFPAQGQTTDTTHLIITDHTTHAGNYVALTRARDTTHIHAALNTLERNNPNDHLTALADRMSRQEPDLASITTPLAHEHQLSQIHHHELAAEPDDASPKQRLDPTRLADRTIGRHDTRQHNPVEPDAAQPQQQRAAIHNHRRIADAPQPTTSHSWDQADRPHHPSQPPSPAQPTNPPTTRPDSLHKHPPTTTPTDGTHDHKPPTSDTPNATEGVTTNARTGHPRPRTERLATQRQPNAGPKSDQGPSTS